MERDDLATLRALGFKDEELKTLGLWDVPTGKPADLAEAYIRRSKKRDDLATLRAHVRDVCRTAAAQGKTIRHVWFEQRSASKAHVRREQFDSAIAALLEGLSKTFYVWKTDRLSRRGMGQVGLLLDDFDKRGARLVSVTEGLDSAQGGRMMFAWLSERAREEAKDIALRTKTGGDAHKAEGRWPGGVAPYGLHSPKGLGKLTQNPKEYTHARKLIAERLLNGITPAEIANDLNQRKISTRKGKQWRAQTVIHLAHSPSWAGLIPDRERATDEFGTPLEKWYRGGPLMGSDGHPIACGEGVVTFAEWQKIQAIITGRSRPGSAIGDRTRGVRKAATIMTGILRCPYCKGPMGNGGANYRCLARINQGVSVCVGVATKRGRVDDAMEVIWTNHILSLPVDSPTIHAIARRWLSYEDPAKEARRQAVLAALDRAASRELKLNKEFFLGATGGMDEATYDLLRADLAAQIAGLKAEVADLAKVGDLTPLMSSEALAVLWNGGGVEKRRALIQAAVKRVTVLPPKGKGDRTPIEKRLVIEWRDKQDARNIDAAMGFIERRRLEQEALQTA
ncbi:recombinase family protein [Streptomyces sp. NPDC006879]|uniref:recombinase family protein n=1 Tax=Streptomyces sp. NPDC006879 TaxID=3364767 RepID=UPI00367F2B19